MGARTCLELVIALVASAGATASQKPAKAHNKVAAKAQKEKTDPSRLSAPSDAEVMPAMRYAALSTDDCLAELKTRNIAFETEEAKGVAQPVRLKGPLHGIAFKTDLPAAQDETTPYQIADCRLVLAVDDFAAILADHDVVSVTHYSMYRPPAKAWPDGKPGTRHNGALALDAAKFTKQDGSTLVVDKDFHGYIDAKTCGDGAGPHPATPEALELRQILCTAVDRHLFNVVLTPNYNREHHNHFHLEVTPGAKWFLVH
jgi:hypothetical protein